MSSAEIMHLCPPAGEGLTPCCGKTPFELPCTDRLTLDLSLVTCHGALLTVVLIPEAKEAVENTCRRLRMSRTDVVNRAVQAYEFLEQEIAAGNAILVRYRDGRADDEVHLL